MLLRYTGKETGYILESYEWDVEAVAESNEPSAFNRSINVQHACKIGWLISHDSYWPPVQARKTNYNIWSIELMNLKKVAFVNDAVQDIAYIVRFS